MKCPKLIVSGSGGVTQANSLTRSVCLSSRSNLTRELHSREPSEKPPPPSHTHTHTPLVSVSALKFWTTPRSRLPGIISLLSFFLCTASDSNCHPQPGWIVIASALSIGLTIVRAFSILMKVPLISPAPNLAGTIFNCFSHLL